MKYTISTVFLFIGFLVLAQSNNDKAKSFFAKAKDSYFSYEYVETIEYLNSAEQLLGKTNPVILNLKIKAYYYLKQYDNAVNSLNKFYGISINAAPELVNETLTYATKIDDIFISKFESEEDLWLDNFKKSEEEILAKIENEKEEQKLNVILHDFENQTCSSCEGIGKEVYSRMVECNYHVPTRRKPYSVTQCNGKGYHIKRYKKSGGYFTGEEGKFECVGCNGAGKQERKREWNCRTCNGKKEIFVYSGNQNFTETKIKDIITNNHSKIKAIIEEKAKKTALTYFERSLTDTIYFSALWKETNKNNATYYRVPQKKVNNSYQIKNYYLSNNKLQMEANAKSIIYNSTSSFVGETIFYRENGEIDMKGYRENGFVKYLLEYDLNGKVRISFYNTENKKICSTGQFGIIEDVKYFPNNMIKYIKWKYLSSFNKKYNSYKSFLCDEKGDLFKENFLNKKGKIKKTKEYSN